MELHLIFPGRGLRLNFDFVGHADVSSATKIYNLDTFLSRGQGLEIPNFENVLNKK